MKKTFSEKGQAVSIDITVSITIFLLVLATLLTIWQNQNSSTQEQLITMDMQANGKRTLDFLVRSAGETTAGATTWETASFGNCPNIGTTKFIGLAKRENVIDKTKLANFAECADFTRSATNYGLTMGKMLLTYDFYFRFLDREGNVIEEPAGTQMVTGKNPASLGANYKIIILKRIVNYEGSNYNGEAVAELRVFRQE